MTTQIAVDAMGGDHGPAEIVQGAVDAARELDTDILLVGDEFQVRAAFGGRERPANIRIVHASDTIGMDAHPTEAVRAHPDASINVALRHVKEGAAGAFVTMGNTGAAMTAALLTLGRVKGIARPALATIFPNSQGTLTMLIDVGANAECRPQHLVQFAHMGATYMQSVLHIENPRVGLLSIGEEDTKGNDLVIEVNQELRKSRLNFAGNIEGTDLTRGVVEVAVMDGFTGNIVLKTAEGLAEMLFGELRSVVESKPWNRAAGLILLPDLRKVRSRLDYSEYGGAQLLGVNGVTVIGHGRSNARAVTNAIRAAHDALVNDVLAGMRAVAGEAPAKPSQDQESGP